MNYLQNIIQQNKKAYGLVSVPLYQTIFVKSSKWTILGSTKMVREMSEQKIKNDSNIHIGTNIRSIRKAHGIGQTELVRILQIQGVIITRETLVKIERGIQHIQASQLRAIRDALQTSYDDLLKS